MPIEPLADKWRAFGWQVHAVDGHDIAAILTTFEKAIITVEEHNVIGGLGSAVLETLALGRGCPVIRIGIPDIFPVIGPTFELRRHLGLTSAHIVEKARSLIRK